MYKFALLSNVTQIMIRQALLPRVQQKDTLLQELMQALRDETNDQNKVCQLKSRCVFASQFITRRVTGNEFGAKDERLAKGN